MYALGIANPDVNELQFIASDPDIEHVFFAQLLQRCGRVRGLTHHPDMRQ